MLRIFQFLSGRFSKGNFEGKTNDSIYSFLRKNIDQDGRLKDSAVELPDNRDKKIGEQQITFAPGLSDTWGAPDDSEAAKKLVDELSTEMERVSRKGRIRAKSSFYRKVTAHEHPIGILDAFLESIVSKSLKVQPYLLDFANDLAFRTNDRNSVKFGIGILGLCGERFVTRDLMVLGLHDEFTLYVSVAFVRLLEDPIPELWRLAKKVDGWGKIHAVEHLALLDLPDEVKDWMLREGYKNSIMYEYLANICAEKGELHYRLRAKSIDSALFVSTEEIIGAMLEEYSPAGGLYDYGHAAELLGAYLRHAEKQRLTLSTLLTLDKIKMFLGRIHSMEELWEKQAWSEELVAKYLGCLDAIWESNDWERMVEEEANSRTGEFFWKSKEAARILGVDIWAALWRRVGESPLKSVCWYDLCEGATEERIDDVIDLAMRSFPMDEFSSGPKDSLGLGPDGDRHSCLGYVINLLEKYPGRGEPLILAALKSPVTRVRNSAIRTLEQWGNSRWSNSIRDALHELRRIEPNKDTKRSIDELISV